MNINYPPPGKYVVAVSGGSDSVALLDLLAKRPELELTVAHFDHQMRDDSAEDAALVDSLAKIYSMPVVIGRAQEPPTSEGDARQQRYDFLYSVMAQTGAAGVVTAHHGDDLLETSLLNVARGTARRGRAPDFERAGHYRPLLQLSKLDLEGYVRSAGLAWREDSTNSDTEIARNFLRRELLPSDHATPKLAALMSRLSEVNQRIEQEMDRMVEKNRNGQKIVFDRAFLQRQSLETISELIATAIRNLEPGLQLDKKHLKELAHAAKTSRAGIKRDVGGRLSLEVERGTVAVVLPPVRRDF